MLRSIHSRLNVVLALGLTGVLIAGALTIRHLVRHELVAHVDSGLAARVPIIAARLVHTREGVVFEAGDGLDEAVGEGWFEIRDSAGVIRRTSMEGGSELPSRTPDPGVAEFGDSPIPGGAKGRAAWLVCSPRADDEEFTAEELASLVPEPFCVCYAMSLRSVDEAMTAVTAALVIVGAAAECAALGLLALGVRWGLRPLNELASSIAGASPDQAAPFVSRQGQLRELVPIHDALDRMMARVKLSLERERSFSGAAAHELRTPLAELRTVAEVALRWPDPDRLESALREVLAVGTEMEGIVESLLRMSRGEGALPGERVVVAEIARRCLERAGGEVSARSIALDVQLDGVVLEDSSRTLVEIVLRNVIENAVQYTPGGGTISIHSEGRDLFTITNAPVELAPKDLSRLFDPFWRGDGARTDRRHAGLGLAVARQAAQSAGLALDASLEGAALTMRITRAADA